MHSRKNITESDLNILLDSDLPDKYKLALKIMYLDGLRPCEVLRLKLDDLEFERNLYRLRKQKNGTVNGAAYMCDDNKKDILEYLEEHGDYIRKKKNGFLIYSFRNHGHRIRTISFSIIIRRYTEKLGIRRVIFTAKDGRKFAENTPHACRVRSTINLAKHLEKRFGQPNIEVLRRHGRWKTYDMPRYYANMLQDDFIENLSQYREAVS